MLSRHGTLFAEAPRAMPLMRDYQLLQLTS
jgi:hypothetical protein